MSTVLKVGAVGALALVGVAAHASIAAPSSGASDAILFAEVVNAAGTVAVASYAGDTGVSINTLLSGTYNGTVLGSDKNLTTLLAADGTGDTVYWGVLGSQYSGTVPNSPFTTGDIQFVTTTNNSSTTKLKTIENGALASWAGGFNSDIGTVNTNSKGASSVEGPTPSSSGVWDYTNSNGTAYWYGPLANYNTLGGNQTLFSEITNGASNGANNTKGIYAAVETVSLSSSGLSFTALNTVPLPAAVWLLGSGLLGLTGVARRKSQA
jgi:hypothetical protein